MTQHENFKRKVRARMEKTGERYTAARRVLLDQKDRARQWVTEPEVGEERLIEATGRGWDEWCDLVDAWPGHTEGHAAIARHLESDHGVDSWWAQTVTVGYERITGLRLPYQRPDGTFTAGKSRTIPIEAEALRAILLDDTQRADVFPGDVTELRSKASTKTVRIGIGPGVALIALEPLDDGRTKVDVAHEQLPTFDDVDKWKFYWTEWLDALVEAAAVD